VVENVVWFELLVQYDSIPLFGYLHVHAVLDVCIGSTLLGTRAPPA